MKLPRAEYTLSHTGAGRLVTAGRFFQLHKVLVISTTGHRLLQMDLINAEVDYTLSFYCIKFYVRKCVSDKLLKPLINCHHARMCQNASLC